MMVEMAALPDPKAAAGAEPMVPLESLFQQYRERLLAMVSLRMDQRVRKRVDPSDIVQEAFLDATRRHNEYCATHHESPYFWLRFLTHQRLLITHRHHLCVMGRDAARELSTDPASVSVSGEGLLERIIQSGMTPSAIVAQAEEIEKLRRTLDEMEETDREILALRHFEQLNNTETAELLGITAAAASQRFHRALKRLSLFIDPPNSTRS
jgi:RNA polymerase sigma-70 factor (ECF subfamily)